MHFVHTQILYIKLDAHPLVQICIQAQNINFRNICESLLDFSAKSLCASELEWCNLVHSLKICVLFPFFFLSVFTVSEIRERGDRKRTSPGGKQQNKLILQGNKLSIATEKIFYTRGWNMLLSPNFLTLVDKIQQELVKIFWTKQFSIGKCWFNRTENILLKSVNFANILCRIIQILHFHKVRILQLYYLDFYDRINII